jgi:hypothetical protein
MSDKTVRGSIVGTTGVVAISQIGLKIIKS